MNLRHIVARHLQALESVSERNLDWDDLEKAVQLRGPAMDPSFRLTGPWKRYVREQEGFKVYLVNGTWIRNNLSVIFGHGGHGLVHEFIPNDEIWVVSRHYDEPGVGDCGCKLGDVPVSQEYFDSCTAHEIAEFKRMLQGDTYEEGHEHALKVEEELGLLGDPDGDDGTTALRVAARYR